MVNTLYSAGAGSVSFDFRDAGFITSIVISATNGAAGSAEISFNSVGSPTTNDTTGVIAGLIQPGIAGGSHISQVFVLREPVDVGERLFLHVVGANATRAIVVTETAGSPPRPAVRRR